MKYQYTEVSNLFTLDDILRGVIVVAMDELYQLGSRISHIVHNNGHFNITLS